jgi:hypothetical protein
VGHPEGTQFSVGGTLSELVQSSNFWMVHSTLGESVQPRGIQSAFTEERAHLVGRLEFREQRKERALTGTSRSEDYDNFWPQRKPVRRQWQEDTRQRWLILRFHTEQPVLDAFEERSSFM